MARFTSCTYYFETTLATLKLCGSKANTEIYYNQYVVDNAGRHYIDFGGEGLINYMSFLGC